MSSFTVENLLRNRLLIKNQALYATAEEPYNMDSDEFNDLIVIEKKIKEVLEIPDKMKIEAFFPIGYESKAKGHKSKMRQRIELDSILFFEKYGNKKMRRIRKIEA